jgi:hypothetical protein
LPVPVPVQRGRRQQVLFHANLNVFVAPDSQGQPVASHAAASGYFREMAGDPPVAGTAVRRRPVRPNFAERHVVTWRAPRISPALVGEPVCLKSVGRHERQNGSGAVQPVGGIPIDDVDPLQ